MFIATGRLSDVLLLVKFLNWQKECILCNHTYIICKYIIMFLILYRLILKFESFSKLWTFFLPLSHQGSPFKLLYLGKYRLLAVPDNILLLHFHFISKGLHHHTQKDCSYIPPLLKIMHCFNFISKGLPHHTQKDCSYIPPLLKIMHCFNLSLVFLCICYFLWCLWLHFFLPFGRGALVAQLVKNLPAMRETWVQSLGWEDPLEKGKAPHFSVLAWRSPWTV